MDIEKYKEAFKRGENIDFFFSKKAIIVCGSLFGGLSLFGIIMMFSPNIWGKIVGILAFLFLGFYAFVPVRYARNTAARRIYCYGVCLNIRACRYIIKRIAEVGVVIES